MHILGKSARLAVNDSHAEALIPNNQNWNSHWSAEGTPLMAEHR
jgi:hypothetical protein